MAADEPTEKTKTLSVCNEIQTIHKLSHKERRGLFKKQKRKSIRQNAAQLRDANNHAVAVNDVTTSDDELQRQHEEEQQCVLHRVWLEREQMAQAEWTYQREKAQREVEAREEQQKKIKEEWDERQRREEEQKEEKERKEKERKEKQVIDRNRSDSKHYFHGLRREADFEALLKEATANERKNGPEVWHNPIAPANYVREKQRENCPFFIKTGACRFGDRCSRVHPDPEMFHTLLFPGMYAHFQLEQAMNDDNDLDVALEYEDSEIYQNFLEFYNDVLPEFNVSDTQKALTLFNARWYGGRQLSGQYVYIPQWKSAICGLFGRNRCPKGKNCNFLHVFCNPGGEFRHADSDHYPSTEASSRHHGNNNRSQYISHDRTNSHRDSHSYSKSRWRSRSRSYSRSRRRSRSRSYSRSPSRMRTRRRSRSRSPSRQHSRRRSRSRSYSRSPDRKRYQRRSNSLSHYRKTSSKRSDSRSPESRQIRKRSRSNSPRQKRSRKRSGSPSGSNSSKSLKSWSQLSSSYSREHNKSRDYYSANSDGEHSISSDNSDHEQPGDADHSKTIKKSSKSKKKHKRKKHRKAIPESMD